MLWQCWSAPRQVSSTSSPTLGFWGLLGRSRFGEEDTFVPGFVQYAVVIVATGTLLMAGHFVEVMVWAITYGLVGIAPPRAELIYLAFGNYTTLGYADLDNSSQFGGTYDPEKLIDPTERNQMFLMLVTEAVHFGEHLKPEFQDWKYRINLELLSRK